MDENNVSWGDASKYLLVPVTIAMAGLCGWTINAFSSMSGEIDEKVNIALGRTLSELKDIRSDLQNLRIDIARLQTEMKLHTTREEKK